MTREYECKHGDHIHVEYTDDEQVELLRLAREKGIPDATAADVHRYANWTLLEIAEEWFVDVVDLVAAIEPVVPSDLPSANVESYKVNRKPVTRADVEAYAKEQSDD